MNNTCEAKPTLAQGVGEFDTRLFRDALGDFPTGVVIVTATSAKGEGLGLTVSSFNTVSLNPPLVLFSIARNALGIIDWMKADRYAINVLHEDQHHVSTRFGRAAVDKWEGVKFETSASGIRHISDALAVFECESYARYDGGDHVILVGKVTSFARSGGAFHPLVFFRGAYRRLGQLPGA